MSVSKDYIESLKRSPIFANLSDRAISRLMEVADTRAIKNGEVLTEQGTVGSEMFVVLSGRFEALIAPSGPSTGGAHKLSEMSVGAIIGEAQLLTGGVRTATVRCCEDATVMVFGNPGWHGFVNDFPEVSDNFVGMVRKRFGLSLLLKYLEERLGDDQDDALDALVAVSDFVHLGDREYLVRQGEKSDAIYFLLQGKMHVVLNDGEKIGEIHPGDSIGETSIFSEGVSVASVVSVHPCLLARMSRKDFLAVAMKYPVIFLSIIHQMQERIALGYTKKRTKRDKSIAIVVLSEDVNLKELKRSVERGFKGVKNSRIVTQRDIVEHFGNSEVLNAKINSSEELGLQLYLEQLEEECERLILFSGPDTPNWALRCVLNATQLVYVASGDSSPEVSALENMVNARVGAVVPSQMLVLLRNRGVKPSATKRWHEQRHLDHLLHVELGNEEDFSRLCRYLTGQAVGLCLSGGAARGFAGFGIIRAMLELGIPIDAIGGASAGGMIASLYSYNRDYDRMMEMMKKLNFWQSILIPFDMTYPPALSFTSGRNYRAAIKKVFGDISIEDLPLPCLLLSANITSAKQCAATRGPFVENFYATNAYPPILPPAVIGGELHVDGGLMNNVPVIEVKNLVKGGHVVAMDVTPLREFQELNSTPKGITGFEVVFNRLLPGALAKNKWPTYMELNSRLKMVNHVANMSKRIEAADVYLQPDMTGFGLFDHKKYLKIADLGYELALEPLQDWWDAQH